MLTDLRLTHFRCFDVLEFFPGSGRTFISGENAQGKTSILEALCILLRLQSPRTKILMEAIAIGRSRLTLDGHYAGAHMVCQYSSNGRELTLDSKPQTHADEYLDEAGRVAWFSNTDLELVRGTGSTRRRYLDFLGMQCLPGYRASLRTYERALRSRNALLKDNRPRREIEAFDQPLIMAGENLLSARAALVKDLKPLARKACQEISGGSDELEVVYQPGASESLAKDLTASYPEEIRLRQTIVGPHRDNLGLTLNQLDAVQFSSEGQQRGIALALKLAQALHLEAALQHAPILLLDDIFGELDPLRRNRLLASLPAQSQAIITTTFLDWTNHSTTDRIFHLAAGRLINKQGG